MMGRLGRQCMPGGTQPDWQTRIGAQVDDMLAPSGPRTININFTNERGLDVDWTGSIRVETGEPTEGNRQNTTVNSGGGSTYSGQNSQGNSRTDGSSGSATGSFTPGKDGGAGGSATAGGSSSETNTSGRQNTTGNNQSSTGSLETQDVQMTAPIIARGSLSCSFASHWSDAVNPFKWGVHIGDAMANNGTQTGTANAGTVTWIQSRGLR